MKNNIVHDLSTTHNIMVGRCIIECLTIVMKWGFVFPWVPFLQMHMVTNISLDLLIGIWI